MSSTAMTTAYPSHLLLLPLPTWGHVRPLCALAARLVSEGQNIVTILIAPEMFRKTQTEITQLCQQFPDGSFEEVLKHIRVVAIFESKTSASRLPNPTADSYPAAYQLLVDEKPISCCAAGTTFDAVPAPNAIIMDFFAVPQLRATRELTGGSVPVFAWFTGGVSTIIRLFGPEYMGGLGDFSEKVETEVARLNVFTKDIGDQMLKHTNGTIINLPGLPTMYDYEFFPQELPFEMPMASFLKEGYTFLTECDGVVTSSTDLYEKVPLGALRSWFSEKQKPVYTVGPLLPPRYGATAAPTGDDKNVGIFLDAMITHHGERSVLYISFGVVFWPTTTAHVDEVVNALLEKKFPFILCHGSPFAKLSEETNRKIVNSGLGMLMTWAPQQFILNHPAIGWFLTHCGHGSIIESLGAGVPLICWPFDADQPAAAANLTTNLGVAFELIGVRTGLGLGPLHRTGQALLGTREAVGIEFRQVIDATRSHEGAEMRRKAGIFKKEFAEAWEEGGLAQKTVQTFLKSCGKHRM